MKNTPDSIRTIYCDDNILFGTTDERHYLVRNGEAYRLSDYPYEPCLYIKGPDMMMTIHNSFTVDQLYRAVETGGSMTMVTGNEYDASGIFRLLAKAIDLGNTGKDSVDIGYVESHCVVEDLKARGAVSEETAVDLEDFGIQNPNVMNTFLHCKKVCRTNLAKYYLPKSGSTAAEKKDDFFRVISNQVRFGYGYRKHSGGRQYFAWHGYPNRNDDLIIYAEISGTEFEQIEKEYPRNIDADRETAELFRQKYVEGHPVILEGWNVSL